MLLFPNAKINLGLRVLRRRPDGYHDIATVMLPTTWCDILEIMPAEENSFRQTGTALDCPPEKNLVLKAIRALEQETGRELPPLSITLEKHIPFGAGLGGGSADAAYALRGVNELLKLGLDDRRLAAVAAHVGADCSFFIYSQPMLATGIGEILEPVDASCLNGRYLLIVKPESESVNTAAAYAGITPLDIGDPAQLAHALTAGPGEWMTGGILTNDFEPGIFALRPEIARLKDAMLDAGAVYAAMSGSGAAVFGIFDHEDTAAEACRMFGHMPHHMQKLEFPARTF